MCAGCLRLGARDHAIKDARGREWRFEVHDYLGVTVLGKRGEPLARQPGSRSPFWPAFELWQAKTR